MSQVLAGCCVPLLGVGPSRRYLLNLYMGARTRTPPRSPGALARFFPDDIGLTSVYTGSARWNTHHNSNFCDSHRFRGCSHSFMFKLPYLLGLPVAPTAETQSFQGSQAVYTTQWTCGYPTRTVVSLHTRIEQLV